MTDWPAIVQEHGPGVWRTISRLVRGEADAADCFQMTFLAALEVARKQAVRHWPALLNRIATAKALEYLRKRYREAPRSHPLDPERAQDHAPDPLARFATGELADALRAALAEIDPRQAQVFCLACLDEVAYRDIAAQLDITVNHVGVLLNRARAQLREILKPFELNPKNERQVVP